MGLFGGKKEGVTSGGLFYEGNIPGFMSDVQCEISLVNDVMEIVQKKSKTSVSLERSRIIDLDIILDKDFNLKYKGNSGKSKGPQKTFYVINYMNKDGEKSKLVFYLYNIDKNIMKMISLRREIIKGKEQQSYEL